MKRMKKSREGFTLIEIIAVLVILGILAAVAIPRYLDMQEEAANKALAGGLAAGYSACSMTYAKALLAGTTFLCSDADSNMQESGDIQVTISDAASGTGCDIVATNPSSGVTTGNTWTP